VRLGRDSDVEEWLATDQALDRPVLIRALDPAAGQGRKDAYVDDVRAAAAVSHIHLARVYEVDRNGAAYAVLEWNGGVSVADRLRAGDTLPVNEFLPNAAGLADGLAALHAAGVVHGAIDPGAILFSAAHPAKLAAYGRPHQPATAADDTRALAVTLRSAITGSNAPDLRPSQVVEGIPRSVDDALAAAEVGTFSAAQLAAALRSARFTPDTSDGGWSWRWVAPASLLLAVALLVAAAGLSIDVDPNSPFLFPATPQSRPTTAPGTDAGPSETLPPASGDGSESVTVRATSFDPFGDNRSERESDIPLLSDGDPSTAWRTERYFSPLSSIKPGVGVVFQPDGPVRMMEIRGSAGTAYEVKWAATPQVGIDGWETVSSGTLVSGTASLQLPGRNGGAWLLWLTALPEQGDGAFYADTSEVSFRP